MAYFFRVYKRTGTRMLVEMEPHEERAALRSGGDDPLCYYEPCTTQRAHQWVRDDGTHETALYIDGDGRIRRAKDE